MNVKHDISEMKFAGVYSIINTRNGKRYIGSTTRSFAIRMGEHLLMLKSGTHVSKHLQNAWVKYGSKSFCFQIEQVCESADTLKLEQFYLEKFSVCNRQFGYNVLPTAGSTLGYRPTDETIEKKRKTMRELCNSNPEFKAKLLAANKKSTDNSRGKKRSAETIEKMKSGLNRPEVLAKISAASKKKIFTPEYREKLSAWQRGKKLSPEHCAAISAGFAKRRIRKLELQLN